MPLENAGEKYTYFVGVGWSVGVSNNTYDTIILFYGSSNTSYIIHSKTLNILIDLSSKLKHNKMMSASRSCNIRRLLAVVLIAITLPVVCVSRSAGSENDRILLVSSAGESPSDERTNNVSPSLRSNRPLKGERSRQTLSWDGVHASAHSRVLKLEEEPVPVAGEEAPAPKTGDEAPPPKTGDAPPPKASQAKAKEGKAKKISSKSKKSAKAAKVVSDVHFHYSMYQSKPQPVA